MLDPVALLTALIACPSVTPADAGAQAVLADALQDIGFTVHRFRAGEAPEGPIDNLVAIRGEGGPHLAFAGHTDVVPPGPGWASDPFAAETRDGLLHGRGAVDMKGAIAAFVAAAARGQARGTLSLLITGDEEGPALHGTRAILPWLAERDIRPDMVLVGEPTSAATLGDTIKVGRRGSMYATIEVPGRQGHVAYPHLADNPIPKLVAIMAELDGWTLDAGTDWFQASNLEFTDITVGNPASNVIPGRATARLSIRFNDLHRGDRLIARVNEVVLRHAPDAVITPRISGEAFFTGPGPLADLVAGAIRDTIAVEAELSTSGGTSDARFLSTIAPTVEFGLLNATMHKLDEAVAVADLHALTDIYAEVIRRALAPVGA